VKKTTPLVVESSPPPPLTMVMVAHVFNAALDAAYPASLSEKTIDGLLRRRLGYDGVVVTDDLGMKAVWGRYGLAEIVVRALAAGADLLMFSNADTILNDSDTNSGQLPERIREIVKKAVEKGELKEERLRRAYERVVGLKERMRLVRRKREGN
jgi:beta-N-acetylhexosaminidase